MTTTFLSLLAAAALSAPAEASVRPLEGAAIAGRVTALTTESVTVDTATGPQTLVSSKLMWLEFPSPSLAAEATIWIELLDGSRLAATSYTAAQGKARIGLPAGEAIAVPTRGIRSVRFQRQTAELAADWHQIVSSMASGDMVVVRKTSTRTIEQGENEPQTVTEQALDQLEGTLLDVTDESVQFEIDGEKATVRRDKLEGLIYFHPTKPEFAPPRCRLIDAAGSTWLLRDLALTDVHIRATTLGNVPVELRLDAVAKIDFSVGNVALLADLEADSGLGEIPLSLQPAAMSYKFSRVFQVRARPPLGAESFRIGGQKFDGGLSLHSPAKLVYRIPAGFGKFDAVAGVDDSVIAPGSFTLFIAADGKELFRREFSGDQSRHPVPITLDVRNMRRLTIELQPASGQDIGDQLDLCEARFTK